MSDLDTNSSRPAPAPARSSGRRTPAPVSSSGRSTVAPVPSVSVSVSSVPPVPSTSPAPFLDSAANPAPRVEPDPVSFTQNATPGLLLARTTSTNVTSAAQTTSATVGTLDAPTGHPTSTADATDDLSASQNQTVPSVSGTSKASKKKAPAKKKAKGPSQKFAGRYDYISTDSTIR
jgi:hypothetical protein